MLCSCFKKICFFINCNRVSDPPMNDDDPVSWDGWRDFDVGDFEFFYLFTVCFILNGYRTD